MSLKLILGSAGSGKTEAVLGELIDESLRRPDKMFIVVVPEQVTMQTQERLTAMHPGGTILNIDVLSFERLAYRVFEELGLKRRELLDETGKTFIIQKIALDLHDELPYFGRRMRAPGSAAAMKSVLSELMQYGIGPDELEEMTAGVTDRSLAAKLTDIGRIYRTYLERLGETFMTAEEVPSLLSEVVDESELIRGSVIAFDGFTGFTPVQERLVQRLMAQAERVLVTVTYDSSLPLDTLPEDDSLFAMSSRMLRSLYRMAGEEKISLAPQLRLADVPRFSQAPELAFLEKSFCRPQAAVYKAEKLNNLTLNVYANPTSEAEGVARRISRLVRTKGWRYRDIAVICGDLASGSAYLQRAFADADIPCFIDLKRSLLGNPFVEYLRAGVEACVDGYSYDSIFRCLKSGMTDLTAEEIDRLENHVLGTGIRGKKRWRTPWTFLMETETPADLEALNASREKVCALMDPLSEAFAARTATVRTRTAALYRFGLVNRCQEKLKGRQETFEENGRLDLAREYAQIYGKVMALYDRLVESLGNEAMPMADYQALLEAGLQEIRIGLVPPGTDQVMVGDVERSRFRQIRALFFVGVNEGVVPKTGTAGSFLTEADRDRLKEEGMRLRPSPREEAFIQNFYLYLALTKPSQTLSLSYVMADDTGKAARPSYLISRIRRLFPALEPVSRPLPIEKPAEGLRLLAEKLREPDGNLPEESWYELYGWFRRHEAFKKRVAAMLKGASYRMTPDVISRAAAARLYGTAIRGSVTRLETFAACPCHHFAQYGLRLKEREIFAYSSLDRGNVIHEALERFGSFSKRQNIRWAELSDEACRDIADRCLKEAVAEKLIFTDGARNAYEIVRLRRSMRRAAWVVREQLKAGDFEPGALEASFADDLLKSSRIALPGGGEMILRGKIDRIDVCEADGVRYVKVIDYKTGSKKFSLTELYHGLQLQLPLYMNAALEMASDSGHTAVPAGFFYHKVGDPVLKSEEIRDDPGTAMLRELRENGFISADPAIYRHFDRELARRGNSDVISLRVTKSGEPYKGSAAGDRETFDVIGRFAARKAAQLGEEIFNGNAAASPSRVGSGESACRWCPYRGVCGFDLRLDGCTERVIKTMDNDEAILSMKAVIGS